jgi:hypothetical protein
MASPSGKMMNAVRFHGKEDLRFEQVPEPECGKGQIKIKPAWCGICGRVCVVCQKARKRDGKTKRRKLTSRGQFVARSPTPTNSSNCAHAVLC